MAAFCLFGTGCSVLFFKNVYARVRGEVQGSRMSADSVTERAQPGSTLQRIHSEFGFFKDFVIILLLLPTTHKQGQHTNLCEQTEHILFQEDGIRSVEA